MHGKCSNARLHLKKEKFNKRVQMSISCQGSRLLHDLRNSYCTPDYKVMQDKPDNTQDIRVKVLILSV